MAAILPLMAACFVAHLRPPLRAPAVRQDAMGLMDALERLIDQQRATTYDREAAYDAVRRWHDDSAGYALARGLLAGRVAQTRGLTAAFLIEEMEKWTRRSMIKDPGFRQGAARRALGTLYVLAPASLVDHGDSEVGLELLEAQVKAYSQNPVNHLRLAEAYLALDDPEPAAEGLCHCIEHRAKLRPSEQRLLKRLIDSAGGPGELECEPSD